MNKKIISKIVNTIENHNLIENGDKILIALSGGADSVFLTCVLNELKNNLNISLFCAHINHGIRGKDALHDELFCKEFCESLNIPFYCERYDIPLLAKENKQSEETMGRIIRYDYFNRIINENNISKLATAHHADDRVETMLMHMIRGCSVRGFGAIDFKIGNVIRPLLEISKSEIIEFLEKSGIEYCNDYTNDENVYFRNKIRNIFIPSLKEYNPNIKSVLLRECDMLGEEDNYMQDIANSEFAHLFKNGAVSISSLNSLHTAIRRRVIYKMISFVKKTEKDISYIDVLSTEQLIKNSKTGKSIDLESGYIAKISYDKLQIIKKQKSLDYCYELKPNVPLEIKEVNKRVTLIKNDDQSKGFRISELDNLEIRNRRVGDYFYPVGMNGKKKLKDFFIDKKIDSSVRAKTPIFTINGEIAAIIGLRIDKRFYVDEYNYKLIIEEIKEE